MPAPRFIEIDGKRYLWRDLLRLRKEQRAAAREAAQPPLFALRDDCRPPAERTASGRYREPSLFTLAGSPAGKSPSNPNPTGADR